jgi:N-hydroxyarylamine O-acetyltransferase
MVGTAGMDPGRYLSRIGVPPGEVSALDRATLERLQSAHVTSVPFETLSITGDPFGAHDGEGVDLSLPALYAKVVDRERGGFCFELNGLFGWLLAELGFEVTRLAARMVGAIELPANHHPLLVTLDREYLVDVGTGTPMLRQPVALDGRVPPDAGGVEWRVVGSDRPDEERLLQYRRTDGEWTDRYVFGTRPRELAYFEATCDYLQSAPESGFTGDPTVAMSTADGAVELDPDSFSRTRDGETTERAVDESAFRRLLGAEFGIEYPPPERPS